jgi:hypothetical protein
MTETAAAQRITLPLGEQQELDRLETVIQAFENSWQAAGDALYRIRGRRLYRATHATFELYCAERWSFGPSRARQLISASRSVTGRNARTEWEARRLIAAARNSDRQALEEEMTNVMSRAPFTHEYMRPLYASDLPEGVRFDRVRDCLEHAGAQTPLSDWGIPETVNPREAALLLARLDQVEAQLRTKLKEARRAIRKATGDSPAGGTSPQRELPSSHPVPINNNGTHPQYEPSVAGATYRWSAEAPDRPPNNSAVEPGLPKFP